MLLDDRAIGSVQFQGVRDKNECRRNLEPAGCQPECLELSVIVNRAKRSGVLDLFD